MTDGSGLIIAVARFKTPAGAAGLSAPRYSRNVRRDEMIEILRESAANMPGCVSYVVAKDAADENTLWVAEVWDSMASHDASLSLPAVKNAIPWGKAVVSNFERIAVTNPVWGVGLRPLDSSTK
jgi:quinol monooxygenase YgiN